MPRKSELYYEEIGDDFDSFMSDYDVEQRAALIEELLPAEQPESTLEVGCGTGAITRRYRHRVGRLAVTDISERLAKRTAVENNAVGQAENATDLSFADNTFDLVISSECIEHCPDPAEGVREMIRVLRAGWRSCSPRPTGSGCRRLLSPHDCGCAASRETRCSSVCAHSGWWWRDREPR